MSHLVFRTNDSYAAIVVSHHKDTTALFAAISSKGEVTTKELIALIREHTGEKQDCTIVLSYPEAGYFRIADYTTADMLDDDIATSKRAIARVKSANTMMDITSDSILGEIQNSIDRR